MTTDKTIDEIIAANDALPIRTHGAVLAPLGQIGGTVYSLDRLIEAIREQKKGFPLSVIVRYSGDQRTHDLLNELSVTAARQDRLWIILQAGVESGLRDIPDRYVIIDPANENVAKIALVGFIDIVILGGDQSDVDTVQHWAGRSRAIVVGQHGPYARMVQRFASRGNRQEVYSWLTEGGFQKV